MGRIRLIHWNRDEAAAHADRLRTAGFEVDAEPFEPASLRRMASVPPEAVVIDLTRTPSHGRDIAVAIRQRKGTRGLPLILVGGDPAKVDRVRALLPDAIYTTWRGIRGALRRAAARLPADRVVPPSVMAGYSGTPLVRKLGIRPETTVALVGAPENFDRTLGTLPPRVRIRRQARGPCHRIVWFVRSRARLERDLARMKRALGEGGGLWIAWPKKASAVRSDLTQSDVRRVGLAAGLVDYKICAIDPTWSGLLFARRQAGKH